MINFYISVSWLWGKTMKLHQDMKKWRISKDEYIIIIAALMTRLPIVQKYKNNVILFLILVEVSSLNAAF